MTITIKGTARKFDQAELERRQQDWRNVYENTAQCCTRVHADIAYDLLNKVIELSKEGYVISDKHPISTSPMSYHVQMVKPESVQRTDLEAIYERVKQEYIAELQAELDRYREQLTQQLLEKAERAEQQKLDAKRARLLADVAREVDGVFSQQLVVPD